MRHLRARTPIAFVRTIVKAYENQGLSAQNALEVSGISEDQLAEENGRIDSLQMESITKCAMQELDDEALGWYRHPMPYGTNAMLCRASLTSVNLGVAIKRWCNHHNLIVDDVHLQLSSDGSKARFTVEKTTSLGDFT